MQIEYAGMEPIVPENIHAQEVTRRIMPGEDEEEIVDMLHYLVRANKGPVSMCHMAVGFDAPMRTQLRSALEILHTTGRVKVNRHESGDTYEPVMGRLLYELPRPNLFRWMRSKVGIYPSFLDLPNHILRFIGYEQRGSEKQNEWWQLQVIMGARAGETFWLPRVCHKGMQVFSKPLFDPIFNQE